MSTEMPASTAKTRSPLEKSHQKSHNSPKSATLSNATDLFELLERCQSQRLDDQRCVLPSYFSQVRSHPTEYKTTSEITTTEIVLKYLLFAIRDVFKLLMPSWHKCLFKHPENRANEIFSFPERRKVKWKDLEFCQRHWKRYFAEDLVVERKNVKNSLASNHKI